MLHLRVLAPTDLSAATVEVLSHSPAVAHLCVSPGIVRQPVGDMISCDVAREAATAVLQELRDLGLERDGAILAENVDLTLSDSADRAREAAPGEQSDALIWQDLEQAAGEETRLSATYLVFMTVATMLASIGVLLDQPILIVGAMVVGPEFGPLVALCVAVVGRRWAAAAGALVTLAVGFAVAMAFSVVGTWLLDGAGLVNRSMLLRDRPLTDFIWQPDALSWIVGFLAGVAGVLSLTSAKSGALVGVLISVTTIPAAGNAAVALAYGVPSEAAGSLLQLVINIASIVVAGLLTLAIQRWRQHRLLARGRRAA